MLLIFFLLKAISFFLENIFADIRFTFIIPNMILFYLFFK